MMKIPYRTRQTLKRVGIVSLVVLLALALVAVCWFVWLGRYVVYTRDQGAVLDMSLSAHIEEGMEAKPPEAQETVSIYYNEGDNAINTSKELQQMAGYYANTEALRAGISQVFSQITQLDKDIPVMLDVKNSKGGFYYSSGVSENRDSKIAPEEMDGLIKKLSDSGRYLIARLPALRDRGYGLHHVSDGVFDSRGAYLFSDGGIYWLNPSRQGTISYLVQIVNELKSLGFDEVVFEAFRFPDTKFMRFDGDKTEALAEAAKTLVTTCATDNFAVSFVQEAGFALPEGRSRLYVEAADAGQAATLAEQTGLANTAVNLVFLTEVHDTRFDAYSVLRPLDAAH